MANVLDNLAADIYKSADVVGRELVGVASSCLINSDGSERVGKGGIVRSHFTRQPSATVDFTPSMTIPEGTDQTVDNKTLTISKTKGIPIPWTGEDIRNVNNGSGFDTIYGDQIAQAMRTLTNEIEVDLATEAYTNASRAVGTAGTNPFASNFDLVAEGLQILADNGCPTKDKQLSLVINTSAGTKLRNLANLQGVNTAGNDQLLRQGTLLDLQGFMLKESAGIQSHTAGTGTGYLINNGSGELIGDSTLTLDTGSGTILAGDVITIAGDTNKYAVNTALTGGDVVIGGPGLRANAADNAAVTVGGAYTANLAFHRTALELVMRPIAMPEGGDAATDSMIVQDPHSGLVFEIRVYKGFGKTMIHVGAAWGYKAWKPEHIALVLG